MGIESCDTFTALMQHLKLIRMCEGRIKSASNTKKLETRYEALAERVPELAEAFETETCMTPSSIFTDIILHGDMHCWEYRRSNDSSLLHYVEVPTVATEKHMATKAALAGDKGQNNSGSNSELRAWLKKRNNRRF